MADPRAAYARHPADPGLRELITEMLALSPVFAQMWAEHEVASRQPVVKRSCTRRLAAGAQSPAAT